MIKLYKLYNPILDKFWYGCKGIKLFEKYQNIHFTEITIFILLKLITMSKKVFKYMIGKKLVKISINNYLKISIFCKGKQKKYQIRGI